MAELNDIVAWSDAEIAALRYEAAREALDIVVTALEDAEVPLEDLMKLWEIGERLATACEAQLTTARERLAQAQPAAE